MKIKFHKYIVFLIHVFIFPLMGYNQERSLIDDIILESINYLNKDNRSPHLYLLNKFKSYDVILLAEDHRVKENLLFIHGLIPMLYKSGIYNLGMEFGASEDQKTLDSLINAENYNEDLARSLMFNYNVGWAFKEYIDIYKIAWGLNKSLPQDSKKFRVINISYKFDWSSFQGQRSLENMGKVFHKGSVEKYRADLIVSEILDKNEKILVLTGTNHAFTRYHHPVYDYYEPGFCRYIDKNMGNLLYESNPDRVISVILHQPFYNKANHQPNVLQPANGTIERIMKHFNNKPMGFDLVGTSLGELTDSSYFSTGYEDFTLKNLFDGYIFIKPLSSLEGCTIDPGFLNEQNWEEAREQIPDCDINHRPVSVGDYLQRIKSYADVKKAYDIIK